MPQIDIGKAFFLLLAAVFLNQVFMRWTPWWKRPRLFWAMQSFNALLGGYVLFFGLPGFPPFTTLTMVLGGLFVFRIVVNISQYQQWTRSVKMSALAEQWERERAEIEPADAPKPDADA